MIKAVATDNRGNPVVFLGLSRLNTELLLQGRPIPVDLQQLHADLPELRVVLLAGESEVDVAAMLGQPLPTLRVIAECDCPDGDTGVHLPTCWVEAGNPTPDQVRARAELRGARVVFRSDPAKESTDGS